MPEPITRVQTGVRLEKRLLKVLKGLAELHDLTLSDLMEGVFLHVIDGQLPFGEPTLAAAARLKAVYGLDLTHRDAHQLREES